MVEVTGDMDAIYSRRHRAASAGSTPRLYQRAFERLAAQIAAGDITPGQELRETLVAAQFGISRAPARRALAELAAAGLVARMSGGAFVVSPDAPPAARGFAQKPAPDDDLRLVSLPSWERIYAEVETEIAARISFATWRVNEAELARFYSVSRTVARDVIGRLQQRGVVRKDDRSRWYAPALTPTHVGELYELRWLLEPVALRKASANLPGGLLGQMRDRLRGAIAEAGVVQGATLDALERDLHVVLLGHCENPTLMQAVTQPQSLLIAHHFLYRWTSRMFDVEPFLEEHLSIVNRLMSGLVDAATAELEQHLRVSLDRALSRIEFISQGEQPDQLPYLERMPA